LFSKALHAPLVSKVVICLSFSGKNQAIFGKTHSPTGAACRDKPPIAPSSLSSQCLSLGFPTTPYSKAPENRGFFHWSERIPFNEYATADYLAEREGFEPSKGF
jgi:hypothetical protein